jgi:hypothetical protein
MWTSLRAPRHWRRRLFTTLALLALLVPALAALAAYPVLDANTGLTLNEGATMPITRSMLRVSMQSTPASGIHYQLTGAPAHGALKLGSKYLIAGDSFTQDDIDNGRLFYYHDGSQTNSDSFAFRAADDLRQPMTRASITSDGSQGNAGPAFSSRPALSADGRYVAFGSAATNLNGDDTNATSDVFVRDQKTGQTTRVSVATGGTQGNGPSYDPAIAADAPFVAFKSAASNLVSGDTGFEDIFVHNWQTGQTTRVSIDSLGTQANGSSFHPTLSKNGRFVAFWSQASNLVSGDTNNAADVFVHDRDVDEDGIFDEPGYIRTVRVSVASNGTQGNNDSSLPALSADGRYVAFASAATNLVSGDTNTIYDVFVHDRDVDEDGIFDEPGYIRTVRVSVASDGTQGNGGSATPALSADGRFIAFWSFASNLVGEDTNNQYDAFVYDRQTGQTTRVSVASAGTQGNGSSHAPALSADGRFVAFNSDATNLVSGDTNNAADVLVHDRQTGQTTRASVASAGTQGNGDSGTPALSADGHFVAFDSSATNLVSGDTNNAADTFVADLGIAQNFAITVTLANDRPSLSPLADQTVLSGGAITIPFQVGDEETPLALSVTASSSNPALVPNANLFLGGAGANRSLAVQPLAGQTGQATITLQVSDGSLTTPSSFSLTVQPLPTTPPPPWLALLYLAGDDIAPHSAGQTGLTVPLHDLLARLNAMPPNPALRLVVLFDGDQPGDSELFVRQPGAQGLTPELSPTPWPKFSSELDSGNKATLRNFVTWARANYPGSPHTLLSIVDHGGGWAPDAGDFGQPRGHAMVSAGGWTGLALDAQANNGIGTSLSTKATGDALAGLGRFDVLFLDACLMGMIETATEVQPYADYLVAGENLLWSRLPYEHYLAPDVMTSTTTPLQLAKAIVTHYNEPPSTDEPFTIAAFDMSMSKLPDLVAKTNSLAQALLVALPPSPVPLDNPAGKAIRAAYAAAQKFDYDSSFSLDRTTDAYVDLADLAAQLLHQQFFTNNSSVTQAAIQVRDEIVGSVGAPGVVVATKAVSGTNYATQTPSYWSFAGAHGLSIYLPLGERDCRPTGRPISTNYVAFAAVAPCVAGTTAITGDLQIEPQLSYYVRPEQLRFSSVEGAPQWAALLARLDATTPNRAAERPPIQSPFPAASRRLVYLPLVRR